MSITMRLAAIVAVALALTACTDPQGNPNRSGTGALIGGPTGAALGSAIGDDTRAAIGGGAAGAIIGGAPGSERARRFA